MQSLPCILILLVVEHAATSTHYWCPMGYQLDHSTTPISCTRLNNNSKIKKGAAESEEEKQFKYFSGFSFIYSGKRNLPFNHKRSKDHPVHNEMKHLIGFGFVNVGKRSQEERNQKNVKSFSVKENLSADAKQGYTVADGPDLWKRSAIIGTDLWGRRKRVLVHSRQGLFDYCQAQPAQHQIKLQLSWVEFALFALSYPTQPPTHPGKVCILTFSNPN